LSPQEIGKKMRVDLGPAATEDQLRLIDAVVARVPDEVEKEKPISAWVLVAANLLPLAGVVFWGWDVLALLVLFWMENVVIGVLNALRMFAADPHDAALWGGKLLMVPFFCVHYGIFTAVHGALVFSMFGPKGYEMQGLSPLDSAARAADDFGLWLPLAVLVASHLFSFFWNYLYRGEFRRARLAEMMFKPYARVMVLHVTILIGGFAAMVLGSPLWALLLLLGLKIGLDWKAHVKEHSSPA
jgi:hypothetical protein